MKTAISLEAALYQEAQGMARKMKVSRSRLFAAAMAEFLERRRNHELFAAVNAAYAEAPDAAEKRLRRAMRGQHRRGVQGRW